MWLTGSSHKVRKHHIGHTSGVCENGSVWEFIKVKTGLVRWRNFNELTKDMMGA